MYPTRSAATWSGTRSDSKYHPGSLGCGRLADAACSALMKQCYSISTTSKTGRFGSTAKSCYEPSRQCSAARARSSLLCRLLAPCQAYRSNDTLRRRYGSALNQADTSSGVGCCVYSALIVARVATRFRNRPRQGSSRENKSSMSESIIITIAIPFVVTRSMQSRPPDSLVHPLRKVEMYEPSPPVNNRKSLILGKTSSRANIPARPVKTFSDYAAGLAPNHHRLAQCTGEGF